jgi:thiamine-phosphate pyrophosphorylase
MTLPRFYPIVDTESAALRQCSPILLAECLLEGGARLLQYRHKEGLTREILCEAQTIAELCRQAGATLIVNDRADLALLLNAGLHVGQDDLPPAEARRLLGANSSIGFSTHNREQLIAGGREPVDYLALGPIFATGSKRNPDPVVGVEQLQVLRALTSLPLVAIGGISRANAQAVRDAGADSLAVIGDLFPADCSRSSLRARAEEWVSLLKDE